MYRIKPIHPPPYPTTLLLPIPPLLPSPYSRSTCRKHKPPRPPTASQGLAHVLPNADIVGEDARLEHEPCLSTPSSEVGEVFLVFPALNGCGIHGERVSEAEEE